MKKILLTVLVFTMVLGASAQTDGFFKDGAGEQNDNRLSSGTSLPGLPRGNGVGATNDDQTAPLGSGLLVLTALGAGYAVSRKNRGE